MRTAIGKGAGLTLGVRFHNKTAEIRYIFKHVCDTLAPEGTNLPITGIGGVQAPDTLRRSEIEREEELYAIFLENTGKADQRLAIALRNQFRRHTAYIHIIDAHCVDPNGRNHACIVADPLRDGHFVVAEEERLARIAALNGSVQVIPMVEHTQRVGGDFLKRKIGFSHAQLFQHGKQAI